MHHPFHRNSIFSSFAQFCPVFPSFPQFSSILPSFSSNFIQLHPVPPSFAQFSSMFPSFEFSPVLPNFSDVLSIFFFCNELFWHTHRSFQMLEVATTLMNHSTKTTPDTCKILYITKREKPQHLYTTESRFEKHSCLTTTQCALFVNRSIYCYIGIIFRIIANVVCRKLCNWCC